nr:hypothetical protein [Pseudodesulfovibrio sp.]
MKKSLYSLLTLTFLLLAANAFAGDIPDMKGTWVCDATVVASVERGIYENQSAKSTLVIEEQQGRVFTGHKTWVVKGKIFTEKIVGGIASDGEIYISEENDGQILGDLNKRGDSFVVFYVESGSTAKVVELTYKKAQ